MDRRHRTAALVAVVTTALLASTAVAAFADPTGTVVLTSSASTYSLSTAIVGDSSYGIVYRDFTTPATPGDLDVVDPGSAHQVLSTDLDPCAQVFVDGPMVVAYGSCTGAATLYWWNLENTDSGSVTVPDSENVLGASPTGWVVSEYADSQWSLADIPTSGPAASLSAPNDSMGSYPLFVDSPTGLVVGEYNNDGFLTPYYESFSSIGTWVTLDTDSTDILDVFQVGSTDVLMEETNGSTTGLIESAAAGGSATTFAVDAGEGIVTAQQSATALAWTDYESSDLYTKPAGGGTTSTLSGLRSTDFVTDGTDMYISFDSSAVAGGIYSVLDAASTPTLVAKAGPAPQLADGVALSPGRVAWNSAQSTSVWARNLSVVGSDLTAAPESLVAGLDAATGYSLSISGIRTVAISPTDAVVASTSGTLSTLLHLSHLDTCESVSCGHLLLSGTRGVIADRTTGPSMYNFATHTLTKVAGVTLEFPLTNTSGLENPTGAAIFGSDLVYLAPGGAIMEKQLGTTTAPVVLQKELLAPSKIGCYDTGVVTWGNWAAWENQCYETTSPYAELPAHTYIKNLNTAGAPVELSTTGFPEAISNNWLVLNTESSDELVAVDLANKSTRVIHDTQADAALDGPVVAWVGTDGSVRAAVLPSVSDAPRYLGNPIAPASVDLSAAHPAWTAEFDTSGQLSACHVEISLGTTHIATVACKTADMPLGVAAVSWDGLPNSAFRAPGTYRFTYKLVASNKYGALEAQDGAATTVTGTFTGPHG